MGDEADVTGAAAKSELVAAWTQHARQAAERFQQSHPSRTAIARDLLAFFRDSGELGNFFDDLGQQADDLAKKFGGAVIGVADDLRATDVFDVKRLLHDEVLEADGTGMRYYEKRPFANWGETIKNRPQPTFVPRTKQGLRNLVKWATSQNKTVRASGYRHTWGNFYSEDDQILVSMLPLRFVEELPAFEAKLDPENELQGIQIVDAQKGLCRIGAATTNEMFREWCLGRGKDDWVWTLPFNVIMVEITYGGSNAPICHGGGWKTTTLSDLVASIEFVNARGELQTVDDPQLLKVAAGCFGLLGIVTSITLKLDPMSYARMQPVAPPLALTVPPPAGFQVPAAVDMSAATPAALEKARQDFVERCENDYYAEWFWFAFQDRCWVNTWKNDGLKENAVDYPGDLKSELAAVMEYMAEVANTTVFKLLPPRWQAELTAGLAMDVMPKNTTIETPLIDALHFQRGIQNMRVRDMEFEIPIPGRADAPDLPDWSICQRAWWDAIRIVYARNDTPMRLTLEMRITGGSSIVLAPQNGNQLGTCSIEVLTTLNTGDAEWASFMQEVLDAWASYTDAKGVPLNIRPHWAKQWQGLKVRGTPIVVYLKGQAYAARLPELAQGLQRIAAAGGYTVADLSVRFSNRLLRRLFGDALA